MVFCGHSADAVHFIYFGFTRLLVCLLAGLLAGWLVGWLAGVLACLPSCLALLSQRRRVPVAK